MSQLLINEMSYSYKKYYEPIFENVTVNLDTDWRLGLIGRNGRGKTTLLKLIHGDLIPDTGRIMKDVQTEIFPYENQCSYTNTMDVIKENICGLRGMEDHLTDLNVLQQYLDADGYEMESRIKREMNRMQLREELLEQDYDTLSGGEKTKFLLIALFLRKNFFILLDEPTNHLDIEGKQTVAEYLSKKKGFIVVSHDREFLDKVIDHVISINKADIAIEKGNYSSWKENKDKKEQYEFRTKDRLERDIISLEKRAGTARNWAGAAEKEKNPLKTHNRGNGSRAAKFMRQAKNSEKQVLSNIEEKKTLLLNYETTQKLEIIQEKLEEGWFLKVKDLSFGYNERILFHELSLKIYPGDIIWIRGKNGAGKSTLLQLLSKRIPNENIEYCEGLILSEAYQEPLWNNGFLRERFILEGKFKEEEFERFKHLCKIFDLPDDYIERPLETYSSGEKKKVDIARALAAKNQLLFLDEPLNFMDIYFREQLEKAILEYQPTMVFVEHDIRFGNNIANSIIEL
ncbi:ribosomal protection-like ABC-F family protein [Anaeromicropila herbilytica]|uniref:Lsa family ABC-F type ribosomal protection protein n=1 Tax=Anaeromicropila herbilytica TaxID=2785025 RepID=A0A7R7EKH2_9FIRM|nr:ATP-binding cassette domain-containing protein [Anaeromicropila herbilytica]BCN30365.1 Lsa family ABC-F type ribosomal protection protein [Anaeromicropila herbilytica]